MFTRLWLVCVLGMTLITFSPGANAASIANGPLLTGADQNGGLVTGEKNQPIDLREQQNAQAGRSFFVFARLRHNCGLRPCPVSDH
jgi:hypothetical protein